MDSRPPPDFAALIARLGAELEARGIPFMLIGGQAVLLHGEPRLTQDVDVTMGIGPDRVQDVLDACGALDLDPLPDDPRAFIPFATAEDLLLHKLFAGRPRDLEDAAGVVRRKGPELDWDYLGRWAREFATIPGREDMPDQLAALRAGA